jgi:hypothetical protein
MVAVPAPSGVAIAAAPPSGFKPRRVLVEKGRKSREMKVGIAAAMRRIRSAAGTRTRVDGCSLGGRVLVGVPC